MKQMTYEELINRIEDNPCRMDRFNVVSYLIGCQKCVTEVDWDNIMRAYGDGFID